MAARGPFLAAGTGPDLPPVSVAETAQSMAVPVNVVVWFMEVVVTGVRVQFDLCVC